MEVYTKNSYILIPDPSSRSTLLLLILETQRCVALATATLKRDLTKFQTMEYLRCHLWDNFTASLLMKEFASTPKRPSTEQTISVKHRFCSLQGARYFFFFSLSCPLSTFSTGRLTFEGLSRSVIRMSTMLSFLPAQKPWINTSPLSSFVYETSGAKWGWSDSSWKSHSTPLLPEKERRDGSPIDCGFNVTMGARGRKLVLG